LRYSAYVHYCTHMSDKRETRTVSVRPGDWQAWERKAAEVGLRLGSRALSVSELIRRAVEAYATPCSKPAVTTERIVSEHLRAQAMAASILAPAGTTPAGWTRMPLGVQTTPTEVPARQPYTKERQTGKKGR
jgi:hypothetical protein